MLLCCSCYFLGFKLCTGVESSRTTDVPGWDQFYDLPPLSENKTCCQNVGLNLNVGSSLLHVLFNYCRSTESFPENLCHVSILRLCELEQTEWSVLCTFGMGCDIIGSVGCDIEKMNILFFFFLPK
ncbi:hypothetical protein MTO96_031334 [Rhipicephalus appendiculatus]